MSEEITRDEQVLPDTATPPETETAPEANAGGMDPVTIPPSEEQAPFDSMPETNTEDIDLIDPDNTGDDTMPLVYPEDPSAEEMILSADPDLQYSQEAGDEVTDIILETLAQQELESSEIPPLSQEQTEQVLDDLISTMRDTEEGLPEAENTSEEASDSSVPDVKKERPVRKGRPRRKGGDGLFSIPHLLSAAIWLLIIVAIGVTLGRSIWVCAADVLAFGRDSREVTISITADDTMETIADKLHKAGLIDIPRLFLLYADLTDVEEEHKITTGTFTLNAVYDYMALVSHMGPRATNRVIIEDVLIPEGFNCRQIFALLEEKGICKAADLEAYAASGELDDYWFLEGVERGDKYCLEGFLFPDTYDFYENSTPKLALEKMLDGFQYRFTEELKEQLPVLNERLTEMMRKNGESEEFIAANQLSLRDLLSVASLIEEETANTDESYRIASVIYNRLYHWGDNPRYLNIDATIIYALGGKTNLTPEDMSVDSPYNTYTNTGLTPGPISNPGLASIQAALNFEDTSYYYYVLNPSTGQHQFSKTYEEHTKWVEKFREAQNNG